MKQSESRKNWLGKLTDRYHEALTPEVLSYLENRGLDRDAVTGSRLGLVANPDPMHEQYRGRLSIPFITPTGVVYIRFRCLEQHDCKVYKDTVDPYHGKYEGVKGEDTRLYNVLSLHVADDTIAVTEGELDSLVSTAAGVPAVGVPGAHAWKPFWYRLFDDFETVLLLGDGDKAGRDFVNALRPHLDGAVPRLMPNGHDVSSFVVQYGADEFLNYVKGEA